MNKNRIIAGMLSAVIVTGAIVGIALSSQNSTNSEVEPTPTASATAEPTEELSLTPKPTIEPTTKPTDEPSVAPSPTAEPTVKPTEKPSEKPSPTAEPTPKPQVANTPVPPKPTKIVTPVPTQKPVATPVATPKPVPTPVLAPYIVRGQVYDGIFNNQAEAGMYADKELINKILKDDSITGYYVLNIEYSDGTWKYTIQWY